MTRKTRKQKLRSQARLEIKNGPMTKKVSEKKERALTMSAEDVIEATVTKRGILKTLLIIGFLFALQAAIFVTR